MSYLRHFKECNLYQASHFMPFIVAGTRVGSVKLSFADQLNTYADFDLDPDSCKLHWSPPVLFDFDSLNLAMENLTVRLLDDGLLPYRHGELFPVTTGHRDEPLFLMDRAVVPYFGIRAFGQHMNGFTRRNGEIYMWIARRSAKKRHAAGMLDHLVAGGLPWGLSLEQNLAKECWEEAGIPAELAVHAQLTSQLSYRRETEVGVKPDTLYCYDLELPDDFAPRCTDGEVDGFELWPLDQVAESVHDSNDIKLNCNLVMIDFLIRHGYIPTHHAEYTEIVRQLSQQNAI